MRVVIFHRGGNDSEEITKSLTEFCATGNHSVLDEFVPTQPNQNLWLTKEQLSKQFLDMYKMFASPEGKPAVVLLPDARHLADDLETLTERLVALERLNCEARCVLDEYADPVQSGAKHLRVGNTTGVSKANKQGIRIALSKKAATGKVLGRTPYGYKKGMDGKLEINQEEARPILSMFDKSASGMGLRRISRYMREKGYKTRSGKDWSQVAIANLLKNRVYVGTYLRCNTHIVGNHPPLVDMDVFRTASDNLSKRRNVAAPRSGVNGAYPLSGLLECSSCGGYLSGVSRYRKWEKQDAQIQKKAYRYYECNSYDCPNRVSISTTKLHKTVSRWLTKHKIPALKESRQIYRQNITTKKDQTLAVLEKQFFNYYQSVLRGLYRLSDLEPLIENLKRSREAAKHKKPPLITSREMVLSAKRMDNSTDCSAAVKALIQKIKLDHKGTPSIEAVLN